MLTAAVADVQLLTDALHDGNIPLLLELNNPILNFMFVFVIISRRKISWWFWFGFIKIPVIDRANSATLRS